MIVDRDREYLFRQFLADHVLVENLVNLFGNRQFTAGTPRRFFLKFLTNDVIA